ncbi:MAG: NAD(P)-binding protein [bacterium]|nr:NAD(P)-binding protein [bacterium]
MSKKIHILGAGLSGMVAGINLARQGYEVLILDKSKRIGGAGIFHPSIHATPVDLPQLNSYIGVDMSAHFHESYDFRVYFGKNGYRIPARDQYGVERGNRKSSMDIYLYEEARKAGVKFEFSREIRNHKELPPGSIIATGLFPEMFESLKVPAQGIYGYVARFESDKPNEYVAYFDKYIGEYYYHGIINGFFFGLIFQRRKPVSREAVMRCQEYLEEREGLKLKEWIYIENQVPMESVSNPRLFAEDKILAGTLSGLMDPMILFGIVGALISGKIAALAVENREKALNDFKFYTRNWRKNWIARRIFEQMPLRTGMMEQFMVKSSERVRRHFMQSGRLAIPGVDSYPTIKVEGRI